MLWSGDESLAQHQVGRHSLCCGVGTSHWHNIRLVGISHMYGMRIFSKRTGNW